jgi:hypothetical protein
MKQALFTNSIISFMKRSSWERLHEVYLYSFVINLTDDQNDHKLSNIPLPL